VEVGRKGGRERLMQIEMFSLIDLTLTISTLYLSMGWRFRRYSGGTRVSYSDKI